MISFHLDDAFIQSFVGRQPAWGPIGYVTYKRTYARDLDRVDARHEKLGRDAGLDGTEEFWLTLVRVVEGVFSIQRAHCLGLHLPWSDEIAQRKAQEMYRLMWSFKFLPPGRGLWMMGTPAIDKLLGSGLFNCAFRSTKDIATDFAGPFTFLMDFSMLGVGVGFDCRGAGTMTITAPTRSTASFVVPDTREGWVETLRIVLNSHAGKCLLPEFDYSLVRPAGSPIKGFGGTASGPGPLIKMVDDLNALLAGCCGTPITSSTIVDIANMVGRCVVAGNVRRSAEIAFGEIDDEPFLDLKDPHINGKQLSSHRWASNNSVFVKVGQRYSGVAKRTAKNGEPGYFWLENAQRYGRMNDPANDRDAEVLGGNPCVPADTIVMTTDGPFRVDSLIGKPFKAVLKDCTFPSRKGFFPTGTKDVYLLKTREGHQLRLTADHKVLTTHNGERWVRAEDLVKEDEVVLSRGVSGWGGAGTFDEGWLLGELVGDGHINQARGDAHLEFWGPSKREMLSRAISCLVKLDPTSRYNDTRTGYEVADRDMVGVSSRVLKNLASGFGLDDSKQIISDAILLASSDFQRGFIRGYFDADGTVIGDQRKGVSARLGSVDKDKLELVQRMLLGLGINSTLYRNRRPAGHTLLPDGKGGHKAYPAREGMELVISSANLAVFAERIGFAEPAKQEHLTTLLAGYKRKLNREDFTAHFESLELVGSMSVFDCAVEGSHAFVAHGVVVHNCLEQSLHDGELCNLVETFPFNHESVKEYKRTLKYAYLYAKTVTLMPTHDPRTNAVTMKNRRIGCSMSGIVQAISKHGYRGFLSMCDEGYKYIQALDKEYSGWLCIPRSIKTTSVKPSGTVSLLCQATPGIHYPQAEYYWRVIRFASDSPMLDALKASGHMCIEIDPAKEPNTTAVYFPVQEQGFERGVASVTMWEQLELAAAVQGHWADNQVSATITFDKATEGPHIARALEMFETRLKGISFLPREDHGFDHAPYQPISKEEYEAAMSTIKPLDLSKSSNEVVDAFCDGDKCLVPAPKELP